MAYCNAGHLVIIPRRWSTHRMRQVLDFIFVIQIVPKTNGHFIFRISLETDDDFFAPSVITKSHFSFNCAIFAIRDYLLQTASSSQSPPPASASIPTLNTSRSSLFHPHTSSNTTSYLGTAGRDGSIWGGIHHR